MNNQPKFKKGDRVRVCSGQELMGLTGVVIQVLQNGAVRVKLSDARNITFFDFELERHFLFPTPDMLAIPDDHVWPETNNQQ